MIALMLGFAYFFGGAMTMAVTAGERETDEALAIASVWPIALAVLYARGVRKLYARGVRKLYRRLRPAPAIPIARALNDGTPERWME